jgi:hypothetical protein
VTGIGQQRHRSGREAISGLDEDKGQIQDCPESEGLSKIGRDVRMMMMAVAAAPLVMTMVVIRVIMRMMGMTVPIGQSVV